MFERKTTFVIGAGASKEFGMPTGDELKIDIASVLSRESFKINNDLHSSFRQLVMNALGPDWLEYFRAGHDLAAAMPSFVSVDEALHYFGRDPKIVKIGKIAIAVRLLAYERKSKLAPNPKTNQIDLGNCSKTWLAETLSMALSFARKETVHAAFQNVSFINFNYDRVIEQYIGSALSSVGRLHIEMAQNVASNLTMIRPYGGLGPLPWGSKNGIEFGHDLTDSGKITDVADKIRTYTEQIADEKIVDDIQRTMRHSQLVIFIGFGFHQQNIALLRSSGMHRPVFATASGIDKDNYDLFERNLTEFFGNNVKLFDKKGFEFMKDLRPTLSAAVTKIESTDLSDVD